MGVIINSDGIVDYSTFASVGLIEWEDITKIQTTKIEKTSFLLIHTNHPQKYIDKTASKLKRRLLMINNRMYDTPLAISSVSLKINFSELERLVLEAYRQNKRPH